MTSLSKHKMTVTLQGKDPVEITSANPDLVRFDITRAKHNWPEAGDAPMLWSTFVAWGAMKRLGLYDGTWDKFSQEDCLDVEMEGEDPADPSRTDPGPSSV